MYIVVIVSELVSQSEDNVCICGFVCVCVCDKFQDVGMAWMIIIESFNNVNFSLMVQQEVAPFQKLWMRKN